MYRCIMAVTGILKNLFLLITLKRKTIEKKSWAIGSSIFYLGYGAIIHSPWKLIHAHSGNPGMKEKEDVLFHLFKDPSKKNNSKNDHQNIYMQLKKQ